MYEDSPQHQMAHASTGSQELLIPIDSSPKQPKRKSQKVVHKMKKSIGAEKLGKSESHESLPELNSRDVLAESVEAAPRLSSIGNTRTSKQLYALVEQARLNEDMVCLPRVGEGLPARKVKKAQPVIKKPSWIEASRQLVYGGFLTLTNDIKNKAPIGLRQSFFDESTNMAVVSALFLTLLFPMVFEHWNDFVDYRSEDSDSDFSQSAFGQLLNDDHDWMKFLASVTHVCYFFGTAGFLFSTLSSVYVLLCVNEIATDIGVQAWVREMRWAVRLPYFYFSLGMLVFVGFLIRVLCSVLYWSFFIVEILFVSVLASVFVIFSQVFCVKCTCNALHDVSCFEPLVLTNEEVESDVSTYFGTASTNANLEDCLFELQAYTPSGCTVPLSTITATLAAFFFHQHMVALMGINLSDSEIYSIASRHDTSSLAVSKRE